MNHYNCFWKYSRNEALSEGNEETKSRDIIEMIREWEEARKIKEIVKKKKREKWRA